MEIFTTALSNKKVSQIFNKNTSPYFHSASLVTWTLFTLKRTHFSEFISFCRFITLEKPGNGWLAKMGRMRRALSGYWSGYPKAYLSLWDTKSTCHSFLNEILKSTRSLMPIGFLTSNSCYCVSVHKPWWDFFFHNHPCRPARLGLQTIHFPAQIWWKKSSNIQHKARFVCKLR